MGTEKEKFGRDKGGHLLPPLDEHGCSHEFLVLVRTPSCKYWAIGHYDSGYKKEQPWRTVHNHPIDVVECYSLPEKA